MRSNASTFTRWISPETNLQPGHIALFWWLGLSDNGTVTCDQLRTLTPAWLRVSASQCSPSPSPSPWWGTLRTEDQELHAEGEKEQLSHTRGCQSPGPWATSGPTTTYVCPPTGYYFNKQTNKQKNPPTLSEIPTGFVCVTLMWNSTERMVVKHGVHGPILAHQDSNLASLLHFKSQKMN